MEYMTVVPLFAGLLILVLFTRGRKKLIKELNGKTVGQIVRENRKQYAR